MICRAERTEETSEQKAVRGSVLKIKTGYNPNSSSIGVDVIIFFTAGAAMTALFNTLAAVLTAAKAGQDGQGKEAKETSVLRDGEKQR